MWKLHKKISNGLQKTHYKKNACLILPWFIRERGDYNKYSKMEQDGESLHHKLNALEKQCSCVKNKAEMFFSVLVLCIFKINNLSYISSKFILHLVYFFPCHMSILHLIKVYPASSILFFISYICPSSHQSLSCI